MIAAGKYLLSHGLAALLSAPAWAQEAGKGELRILVGFPAGGTVDAIARSVADKLKNVTGGAVLIENKPGGR